MKTIDEKIQEDLLKIQSKFKEFIIKVGLFGSILDKSIDEVNDIDVLILYKNISFKDLKTKLIEMNLNYPIYPAYLNVTYIASGKSDMDPIGYHMILMPIDNPCPKFLQRHEGKIHFFSEQFEYNKTVGVV